MKTYLVIDKDELREIIKEMISTPGVQQVKKERSFYEITMNEFLGLLSIDPHYKSRIVRVANCIESNTRRSGIDFLNLTVMGFLAYNPKCLLNYGPRSMEILEEAVEAYKDKKF